MPFEFGRLLWTLHGRNDPAISGLLPSSLPNSKGIFMSYGFFYLLFNSSMPGLLKIGYTDRSPSQRAYELSSSTGVPCEFEILGYFEMLDARSYEQYVHQTFDESRVSNSREFFRISMPQLVDLIEGAIEHGCTYFVEKEVVYRHMKSCEWMGMASQPSGGWDA